MATELAELNQEGFDMGDRAGEDELVFGVCVRYGDIFNRIFVVAFAFVDGVKTGRGVCGFEEGWSR